jgi:hypothetical protein
MSLYCTYLRKWTESNIISVSVDDRIVTTNVQENHLHWCVDVDAIINRGAGVCDVAVSGT